MWVVVGWGMGGVGCGVSEDGKEGERAFQPVQNHLAG